FWSGDQIVTGLTELQTGKPQNSCGGDGIKWALGDGLLGKIGTFAYDTLPGIGASFLPKGAGAMNAVNAAASGSDVVWQLTDGPLAAANTMIKNGQYSAAAPAMWDNLVNTLETGGVSSVTPQEMNAAQQILAREAQRLEQLAANAPAPNGSLVNPG